MHNFVWYNPTKVLFGKGTVPAIGPETAAYGKRCLLVYGSGSIRKNGIYDTVVVALRESGLEIVEHGGVRPNPLLSHVQAGIAKAREHRAEVIVAVGGGSVLDSAKAICAGAVVEPRCLEIFHSARKASKRPCP